VEKTRPRGNTYTLWGGALSLYTGKVRSYLIKAGIPYREYYTVHPEYRERVLPIVRLGVSHRSSRRRTARRSRTRPTSLSASRRGIPRHR
jgi:hypothetical protein